MTLGMLDLSSFLVGPRVLHSPPFHLFFIFFIYTTTQDSKLNNISLSLLIFSLTIYEWMRQNKKILWHTQVKNWWLKWTPNNTWEMKKQKRRICFGSSSLTKENVNDTSNIHSFIIHYSFIISHHTATVKT